MLKTGCAQNQAWQHEDLAPLSISVNLSPRQLRQKNLVDMITQVLAATGLPAHLLELEIIEGAIIAMAKSLGLAVIAEGVETQE